MESRVGLLFIFLLGACWACDARQLGEPNLSVLQLSKQQQEQEKVSQTAKKFAQNENLCTLCEEFAAEAVDYFSDNKTQTEIMNAIHLSCSHLPIFNEQCFTLVDCYVPRFFMEISNIQPADFCRKFNLCQQAAIFSSQLREDSCQLCHHTVSEVFDKLQGPDTQCKKLVFEYGPLILANTERFLETTEVCTILRACKSSTAGAAEAVRAVADS